MWRTTILHCSLALSRMEWLSGAKGMGRELRHGSIDPGLGPDGQLARVGPFIAHLMSVKRRAA